MSALRNMFLLSSIAIGLIGFSDRFIEKRRVLVKLFAIGILILSIFMGLTSTGVFNTYHIKHMNSKQLAPSDKVVLEQARMFPIFAYIYSGILSILILTVGIKMIKNMK
tara:strand:- start:1950 stop:2276 length:327 start_codon:yes stop_codon:yes gene_type:complete